MALSPCKSCKHSVDISAKTCPSCGVSNPGVTIGYQIAALVILGIIIAVLVSMCSGGSDHKSAENAAQRAALPSYSITKDEFREGRPRKVEVVLPERIGEAELAEVAQFIRTDTEFKAEKTFIGFRIEGQTGSYYWANAIFDPDFSSSIIGVSASNYQTLKGMDLKEYPDMIGSWLRDDAGRDGYVMVLYKRNGKYLMDSIFPSGEKRTEGYQSKKFPDGGLRLEVPDNGFGEYYVVDAQGNLQGFGENGVYLTLPPFKAKL
ncbi:zinc ribbon domain-containing protein [Pseudomonas sp. NPDC098747]|uniref:zinc ribbon domain-containing protein n=1 Tax=Pseudomonas sp. NPDC098747 TaxID=3364487 RepID=UPI00383BF63D